MLVNKSSGSPRRLALDGLHHVTAVTAEPGACERFYRGVLGLSRLDPALAYEPAGGSMLAFGDLLASPGAVLNFLVAPRARRGRTGVGAVVRIGWRVADVAALDFWEGRLRGAAAAVVRLPSSGRDALPVVRFADPEGLEHELRIDASGDEPLRGSSHEVPERLALRGLDGVDVRPRDRLASSDLLAGRLDFAADGPAGLRVHGPTRGAHYLYEEPGRARSIAGAGTVDHVAFACDWGHERIWRQRVIGLGARVSPIHDGDYYRSLRFREPGGVAFEIATRGALPVEAPAPSSAGRAASAPLVEAPRGG
jgi:glyoxalase family protein